VLALDHVLLAVDDLAAAGRLLEERFGLASIEGGRHPGWGTANRIVPLGDAYLELIAVDDEEAAAVTPFGRWVAGAARPAPQPLGWAVRTDSLDTVAQRRGLTPAPGARARPDGEVLSWHLAGVEVAVREPGLPFFIEWELGTSLPGWAPVTHPAGSARLSRVVVTGDRDRLEAWLGPHELPLEIRPGPSALEAVGVAAAGGEICLAAA
jgi:hypothetical protein